MTHRNYQLGLFAAIKHLQSMHKDLGQKHLDLGSIGPATEEQTKLFHQATIIYEAADQLSNILNKDLEDKGAT